MRTLAIVMSILGLAAPALAAPVTEPVYQGPMMVSYNPIMCIMAPCPPGDYTVTADEQPLALAGKLTLEVMVEGKAVATAYEGQYLDNGNVEGALWFDPETRAAFIRVDRFGEVEAE